MATFLYFVSGHGFGHAVRSALVVRELSALGHRCVIVSGAPRYIFEINLRRTPFYFHPMKVDEGVAQFDGLRPDLAKTLVNWRIFFEEEKAWFAAALELCRKERPDAVLSDVSPLAFGLARRAGLPSFLISSFTWEWILEFYRDDDPAFGPLAGRCGEYYRMADGAVYTPFSYGLPQLARMMKVPLIAKRASAPREMLRARLGLDERPAFLISFGGCGISEFGKMELQSMPEYRFVVLGKDPGWRENILTAMEGEFTHEDALAACDAVVGKPGYGTVAECILNRTPLVYTSRGKFAEYRPMIEEMRHYLPGVFISQEDLFSGGLKKVLGAIPAFGPGHASDPGSGSAEAARVITEWLP